MLGILSNYMMTATRTPGKQNHLFEHADCKPQEHDDSSRVRLCADRLKR